MPDYKNGKIYTIRSPSTDKVYIGSTTTPLSKRFSKHKCQYNIYVNPEKRTLYMTSYDILKHGDAYIELLELYPCNSKEELTQREGQLMRSTENCCNKRIEGRTRKEYKDEPEHKEIAKEYVKANKDKIDQTKRAYYERNKDLCLDRAKASHLKNHEEKLQKMRDHYNNNEDNKAKAKARTKAWALANKARLSEKIVCQCGSSVIRRSLTRHKKTKKHIDFVNITNLVVL